MKNKTSNIIKLLTTIFILGIYFFASKSLISVDSFDNLGVLELARMLLPFKILCISMIITMIFIVLVTFLSKSYNKSLVELHGPLKIILVSLITVQLTITSIVFSVGIFWFLYFVLLIIGVEPDISQLVVLKILLIIIWLSDPYRKLRTVN